MNNTRKLIAIIVGALMPCGYLAVFGVSDTSAPNIIVGIIFGITVTVCMIRNPEHVTYIRIAFILVPLMVALAAWVAVCEPTRVLTTIIWALIFIAMQIAFLMRADTSSSGRSPHLQQ